MVALAQATQAQSGATGSGTDIGGLTVSPSVQIAEQIQQIQLSLLNDTNADAAIMACFTELSNAPAAASKLVEFCVDHGDELRQFVGVKVSLKRQQQIGDLAREACAQTAPESKGRCVAESSGQGGAAGFRSARRVG
jgi:hypothetical protein